ncbi:MAG TPA: condensation domain-containing protein [Flavobacterium sp.]|nr:condensation domain-containing protein [Flavobacterium sp.]
MNTINIFFNKLKFNSGAIWLENETIKAFVPPVLQNQETKDFIINNKSELITILKENKITSKELFSDVIIFVDKNSSHYPLSVVQERLWLFEKAKGGSNTQHLPQIYELDVNADIEGIKHALRQIVSRHEILRSTIEQKNTNEKCIQVVNEEPLPFESQLLIDTNDYMSIIKEDIHRPFCLSSEYPIRVKFYTITSSSGKPTKTLVLINIHFIAHDGWSYDIFQKELFGFYEAYKDNDTTFSFPALEIQYKDYALWQQAYLEGDAIENQLIYWKNKLKGYQRLELPTDYPRPSEINYNGAEHVFNINKKISGQLHEIAKFNGVTLNSVMISSVNILLGKYTGQDDIVIGRVMANRHHWQTKEVIGAFANRLANRTILKKEQSFNELVQQVHQDQIEAQLNQDLPIEKLIEALQIEQDSSMHPIFQVMFSVQDFGNEEKYSKEQQNFLKPLESEGIYQIEKFDLSIFIDDFGDDLSVQIGYFTSLFHKDTIENMAVQFLDLLEQLVQSPDKAYSQFSLLPSQEHILVGYEQSEC